MSRFRYLRQARKLTLHLESPPLQRNMLAARNEAQPFKWRHQPMTWIKTLWMDDDERVKKAIEEERKLYPPEYATPVPAVFISFEQGMIGSHPLIPERRCQSVPTLRPVILPPLPVAPRQPSI